MKAKTKIALWLNTEESNIKDFELWDNVILVKLHHGRAVFIPKPILSCKFIVPYLRQLNKGEGWQCRLTKQTIKDICKKHTKLQKLCKKNDHNLRSDCYGWYIMDRDTNKVIKYDNFTL